jgi:acyl-coenzyme A synthetase/AMP-(fatty) acid ligase
LASIEGPAVAAFEPERLAFDHPLWIVYSSGTTGKPKASAHSHGGTLLGLGSDICRICETIRVSLSPRFVLIR